MRVWVIKEERNWRKMEKKKEEKKRKSREDSWTLPLSVQDHLSQGQAAAVEMEEVEVKWSHDAADET